MFTLIIENNSSGLVRGERRIRDSCSRAAAVSSVTMLDNTETVKVNALMCTRQRLTDVAYNIEENIEMTRDGRATRIS
ncbi:hypothetical protein O9992_23315 [Vibrio lentus]|nr:hypothetical protein [Vibrio lentus]